MYSNINIIPHLSWGSAPMSSSTKPTLTVKSESLIIFMLLAQKTELRKQPMWQGSILPGVLFI